MGMLKQKEKFSLNPTNYAMAKSRIKKEIDTAKATGDEKLVESLSNKLITIEERAEELDKKRNEKISTIALINDKNRKKNIERAELGIKQEMERIKKEGVVSDPFTRRKTQPVLPTHVLKKKEAELKNGPQASNKDGITESQDKIDKENLVKKECSDTKVEKDATAEDLFSAHNFDITIDLGKTKVLLLFFPMLQMFQMFPATTPQ